MNWPILSVLVWLPILGGTAVMVLGSSRAQLGKQVALGTSILTFVLSLSLWTGFDFDSAAMQFVESVPWIERFSAFYALGVDGIAMPLVLLTTFLTPFVVVAGWEVIETRPAQYFAAFLILEGFMIGTFAATDALLFYVFWEAMLVPMFIIIGVWGGARRVYATVKFFLYTFLGSVFMLVALVYMYLQAGDDGRFSDLGGDPAQDGRVRLHPLQLADRPGCEPRARLADDRVVLDRRRL